MQFQKSAPLSETDNLTKELCACTDDIKAWMKENQLKLNNKTEALLFSFFIEACRHFPAQLHYSQFSQHPFLWFC